MVTAAAPSTDEAKEAIEQVARYAGQCTSWTDEDGAYTLTYFAIPRGAGDQNYSVRLNGDLEDYSFDSTMTFVREKSVVTVLMPISLGEPIENDTVLDWLKLIDERD